MNNSDPNALLAEQIGAIKPVPLRERFARFLGFRYPPFPSMDVVDKDTRFVAGSININMHLKLDLKDRLLVLLGGNVAIRSHVKTNVPVGMTVTRVGWSVIEPGADFQ